MSGTCPILQSTIDPRQAEILESIAVAAQFVREERSFHFRSSSAAAGSGCGFYVFPHPFTYDIHADERGGGSAKRLWPGLVNFVAALAYHFCLALPALFTQPGNHHLAEPCNKRGYQVPGNMILTFWFQTGMRTRGRVPKNSVQTSYKYGTVPFSFHFLPPFFISILPTSIPFASLRSISTLDITYIDTK